MYPTDLPDSQWQVIENLLLDQGKRKYDLRQVFNAIFYIVKGGIPWRLMPNDLPPWKSVYYYYAKLAKAGIWQEFNDALPEKVRQKKGRKMSPSAAILDSQSTKTSLVGGQRGYDAAKQVKGRKRHNLVDTLGLLLAVGVHRADSDERKGATFLLRQLFKNKIMFARLSVIFADGGYSGEFEAFVRKTFRWLLQIVRKPLGVKTFQVLAKRWIVERTFSWLSAHRRLSVEYERKGKSSEAMIHIAMIRLMLKQF